MGLLWKPPPWVVTMASAWQLFGGFALLLQLVGHVPPSGVNLEGASPFASVVTAEFTKEPLSSLPLKTLFCSLKRRTIPWMPLPVPSTALATKHNVWPQLVRPKFGLQPLLLKSVFRRIELRFPDTVLIVSVPEAAPDLAVTVAVVEVMRSTVAFPNLSVRIGMLAASIGFAGLPRNSRPAVLLKRTSCPGSGKPSSLATVATTSVCPQDVIFSRSIHACVDARGMVEGLAATVTVAPLGGSLSLDSHAASTIKITITGNAARTVSRLRNVVMTRGSFR